MFRRIVAVLGTAALTSGGAVLLASTASAEIERCSGPRAVKAGVTVYSCINVNSGSGLAYSKVYFNLPVRENLLVCDTIYRSGVEANYRCISLPVGPGNSVILSGGVEADNPPNTQQWFSQSNAGAAAEVRSPNVYDT